MVCADGWYGRCTNVIIFPGSDPGLGPVPPSAVNPDVRLGKCSTGGTNNCPPGVRGVIQWPPERLKYMKSRGGLVSPRVSVVFGTVTVHGPPPLVRSLGINRLPFPFSRSSDLSSKSWCKKCVDFLATIETANPGGPAHPVDLSDTDSSSDYGLTEMTDIEEIPSLVLPSEFGLRVPSVSMSESEEVSISLPSEETAMNDSSGGSAEAESESGSTESGGFVPRRQGLPLAEVGSALPLAGPVQALPTEEFIDFREMATNVMPTLTVEIAPKVMVRVPEAPGSGANVAGGSGGPIATVGSNEERSSSGSLASSANVVEEDRFVRYNAEAARHFPIPAETSSMYIQGPNTPGAQLSRRAALAAACRFGLGPESGFRFFYPREEDRIFHIRRNFRRVFLYRAMFEAGFRLPGHPFYWEVLKSYGLAVSQITPNGWLLIVGEVVLASRLVHAGLGPHPYPARLLRPTDLALELCSPLPIYEMVEDEGQMREVERFIIVNVRGRPPTYIPSPNLNRSFEVVEYDPYVWAGTEWTDGVAPSTPQPASRRGAGKDMMTLRALELARVRHQGDRSSSTSDWPDGPGTSSQAMNPQKLAEAQRRAAETRQRQIQVGGTPVRQAGTTYRSTAPASSPILPPRVIPRVPSAIVVPEGSRVGQPSAPAGAPFAVLVGHLLWGGFGDWVHRDQDATPNSLLDLLANFFCHGMSFGSPSDYDAVRGLGNLFAARVNFAEYEENFRSVAPSLARLIDERMPAQNVNQAQAFARERDNALQEVSDLGDKLKELKAKYKETDRTLRRERDDHRSELQRREAEERTLKVLILSLGFVVLSILPLTDVSILSQIRIAELEHENAGCYVQIVYEKEKSRDSALHMIYKYKGFSDFAGIPFDNEEAPDNYPSPEPAPPLVLPEFGDSSQAAQAPLSTDAAADGDEFEEYHRVLSKRKSGRDVDRHARGSKRRKEK
ncbi:hypothetical protein CCACVL1_07847 [Corchorus capsularis]|uniref:Transposase (putative) gypsy type domain-containing protein n=1 Tax=Corchorus capsularis TaxID=210143 RepID=A0A1R3J3M6_COCAP|nr:hypothetical protein CCACVL1_07847 [Corchorus capsularis]